MCEQCDYEIGGCYCMEDQGAGYTYQDEHGDCDVCCSEYNPYNEKKYDALQNVSEGKRKFVD